MMNDNDRARHRVLVIYSWSSPIIPAVTLPMVAVTETYFRPLPFPAMVFVLVLLMAYSTGLVGGIISFRQCCDSGSHLILPAIVGLILNGPMFCMMLGILAIGIFRP